MNKYIEAEKLIAEIERRIAQWQPYTFACASQIASEAFDMIDELKGLLIYITSLQQEQPTRGYDEAYLNECIAKARKTWKGVDVDKYMDEMRGREQEQPDNEDIDKVAQELYEHLYELKRRNNVPTNLYDKQEIIALWKAGIEYGRNHPKQEQPADGDDGKFVKILVRKEFAERFQKLCDEVQAGQSSFVGAFNQQE